MAEFSITLPYDMAEVVESKVKSGGYASMSEVVRDGVRALLERDAALGSPGATANVFMFSGRYIGDCRLA
jgi:Arc/MetJ-type ribon-helix-helix transcriptional regulator